MSHLSKEIARGTIRGRKLIEVRGDDEYYYRQPVADGFPAEEISFRAFR
jgi:hypothetical protein